MQLAGHHAQCQWQVAADSAEFRHGRLVTGQPGPVDEADQQRGGLPGREGVEADRGRVLERGQVPAAGDKHQAPRRARQQRPDLLAVDRVVEDQQ